MPLLAALTGYGRPAAYVAAILAFALGVSGRPISDWSSAAQTNPSQKRSATTATSKAEKEGSAAPKRSATTAAAKAETEGSAATTKGEQAIIALVNDEPITAYEIEQRARFLALNANVSDQAKQNFERLIKAESTTAQFRALQEQVLKANQGKSREEIIAIFQERQKQFALGLQKQALDSARSVMLPRMKKDAREELIEERLKLQEAKKLGIEVSDDDVKRIVSDLAGRNKMTHEQFAQHLKGMGVDVATMGERFRAQRAWRDLIARRYGAQISVTQRDIDRVLSSAAVEAGVDTLELQVHKIALVLPSKLDQTALAKRFTEAEALRRKFSGCKSMGELAKTIPDARFEDMKYVKPSSIPEPTRSMLLSAKDGDILPPSTTGGGVEVYAVCARRTISTNDAQRTKTQEDLQYKELDILAQRHMRNLRQDAHIEYR